jgi:nitrite reductase/ring-hydroxylating ferredoxin subunit
MSKDYFVASIKENQIKDGQMKAVHLKGKTILLVKQGGQIFGVSNRCPHMGCSFEGGILRDYLVICPCHGWKFDIRNGQYEEIKEVTLTSYKCKIQNGKVYVEIASEK